MHGWFDSFRSSEGGPTLYSYSNRTSVVGDVPTITIFVAFITVYFAFLLIFPGVRKERLSTFCTVTLSLLTGIIICLCNFTSEWEVGRGVIQSSYRAFSPQKIQASLRVSIGLDHANISLKVLPSSHHRSLDIDFNEKFEFKHPDSISKRYYKSLEKGLPYPILAAAEYFALDEQGFMWGRMYRHAGYYTGIIIWVAFASWILSNFLLLHVPRYGAYCLTVTGALMILSTIVYWSLKPSKPLLMRIENTLIQFQPGNCYWLTLIVGILVVLSGITISTVDWIYPNKFSTILEIDFDTPYDRHIIIEDSLDTRKRRFKIPSLEDPLSRGRVVGSRILRRLSNRGKSSRDKVEINPGVDNSAFEMEHSGNLGDNPVMTHNNRPQAPWKSGILNMHNDSKKSFGLLNRHNDSKKSVVFNPVGKVTGTHETKSLSDGDQVVLKTYNNSARSTKSKISNYVDTNILTNSEKVSTEDLTNHDFMDPSKTPRETHINLTEIRKNSKEYPADIPIADPTAFPHDEPRRSVKRENPQEKLDRQNSSQSFSSGSSMGLGSLGLNRGLTFRKDSGENPHRPLSKNVSANIIVFHRTDSRGEIQRSSSEVVEIQTDDE